MQEAVIGDVALLHSEQRLQQAAKVNDTVTIRELIQGKVNLNARNSMKRTALHWAALAGHEEAAGLLLDCNALVDVEDKFGMTPVLLAASHGYLTILQTLVKAGATVTARNKLGQNLLHCAALQGHPSIIRYVVEDLEGIPADDPDQNGKTPLLLAAENGHSDVLRLLCELGCDLQAVDKESNSALHLVTRRGHVQLLPYLMLAISSEAQNQDGLTPLHLAAQAGHLSCMQMLLDGQCQVNALSSQHLTALHLAISHGHLEVCHLLVQEGIDVNAKGNKDPCLHLAVKQNTPQLIQRLLAAGCDVNICDSRQQSALHVAVERRQQPIVDLLLRANINLHLQDQVRRLWVSVLTRCCRPLPTTYLHPSRSRWCRMGLLLLPGHGRTWMGAEGRAIGSQPRFLALNKMFCPACWDKVHHPLPLNPTARYNCLLLHLGRAGSGSSDPGDGFSSGTGDQGQA